HLAIRLQRERKTPHTHSRAGIESTVQTPIGIEAGHPVAVRAVDGGKLTTDKYLPIRLHGDRADDIVRARAGIETAVQTPIGIEPGHPVAVRAIDRGEITADEHFAIRLQRDQRNTRRLWLYRRSETAVETSVGIE